MTRASRLILGTWLAVLAFVGAFWSILIYWLIF